MPAPTTSPADSSVTEAVRLSGFGRSNRSCEPGIRQTWHSSGSNDQSQTLFSRSARLRRRVKLRSRTRNSRSESWPDFPTQSPMAGYHRSVSIRNPFGRRRLAILPGIMTQCRQSLKVLSRDDTILRSIRIQVATIPSNAWPQESRICKQQGCRKIAVRDQLAGTVDIFQDQIE